MKSEYIKNGFVQLAEEKVPETYLPWPKIKDKLQITQPLLSTKTVKGRAVLRRLPLRVAFFLLLAAVISSFFLFTSAGRVSAEQIGIFFVHVVNNWKSIPSEYNRTSLPDARAETQTPAVLTGNSWLFFTLLEQKSTDQAEPLEHLNREEAAAHVKYRLREPKQLPDGYQFSSAIVFPENKNILLIYAYDQPGSTGEMILLTISPTLIKEEVGPDAKVERISINGHEGEMVQGGWIALAGEDRETWESRMPVTTLRWFDGELYVKLQFQLDETYSPSYLDLSQMLKVAESVRPPKLSELTPTPISALDAFGKMEEQVGFVLLQPGILPPGYELVQLEKVPESEQVYAEFRPPASGESGPRLSLSQILLSALPELTPQSYPPDVQIVDIQGVQGRLMEGVNDGSGSYPSWWLFWENQDLAISLWYYPGLTVSEKDAKEIMIEIAKSMR